MFNLSSAAFAAKMTLGVAVVIAVIFGLGFLLAMTPPFMVLVVAAVVVFALFYIADIVVDIVVRNS